MTNAEVLVSSGVAADQQPKELTSEALVELAESVADDDTARVLALAERLDRNRSDQSVADLAVRLSELLLLPATDLLPSCRSLVDEAMADLLPDLDAERKLLIARRVAGIGEAPHRLLKALLEEEISVARVILEVRKDLPDHLLLSLVESASRDHKLAIAKNKRLSASVANALVNTDDNETTKAVLRNKGAILGLGNA